MARSKSRFLRAQRLLCSPTEASLVGPLPAPTSTTIAVKGGLGRPEPTRTIRRQAYR